MLSRLCSTFFTLLAMFAGATGTGVAQRSTGVFERFSVMVQ